VSAWRSEAPVTETIGEDDPPPSRRPWLLWGLVLVALAAGFAVGHESRGVSVGGVSLGVDPPALAAGALRPGPSSGHGVGLVLPAHNAGASPAYATVVGFPGLELRRTPTARVPAGAWADVSLEVGVDCDTVVLATTATVRTGADARDVVLTLGDDETPVMTDLRDAVCEPRQSLTRHRLTGVWLVERVFGRWTELAGRHVLRFRRDGSFVADPEGVRFTSHRGVLGRYRLRGPFLDAVEQGFIGYACLPGEAAVWRAGQLADGRLVLSFVRGRNCPDQPGEVWLLRRVVR
jgi:hypothetical protein